MNEEKSDLAKFQDFMFEMSDVLESFISIANMNGYILDYSLNSLENLEHLIDSTEEKNDNFMNRCARYLGEVFRKELGGHWDIDLENPVNYYYKLPVIAKFSATAPDLTFCPLMIIRNYMLRGRRGLLLGALNANR
ncbi:hypothetical protein WH50_17650 [Pokkaliibacter plantistimulans]|uniref:Uncharacterized protein n=1 Tax=Pokkaliibacter plantistimulans TaxID=1635171 RepID=A0ABX5LXG0_9GAMM|nr:hypothetical protein [Pokkaliibacter plantistimulans]PXF29991.1 hypothetical protein WH50_17650 [Pokkaliibacter plantistimulans]